MPYKFWSRIASTQFSSIVTWGLWTRYIPGQLRDNGMAVARFLARTQFSGKVFIHSVSEPGSQAMKKLLPDAVVQPFGSFNIRLEPER